MFVDVGAAHFRNGSTTYYLEKHLGWSGIAVDALPEYAPDYARERPATRYLNYIVTDRAGAEEPFYRINLPGGVTLSTKFEMYARDKPHEELLVPTITLSDLLDQNGVEKVDFVSLDIEGSEGAALRGFDIERFAPELVCVEATHPQSREFIPGYFAEHGYERIEAYAAHDRVNHYYAPKR